MKKKVMSIILAAAMPLSTFGGLNCFANGEGNEGSISLDGISAEVLTSAITSALQKSKGTEKVNSEDDTSISSSVSSSEEKKEAGDSNKRNEEDLSKEIEEEEQIEETSLEEKSDPVSQEIEKSDNTDDFSSSSSNVKESSSNTFKKASNKLSFLKQGISKKASNKLSSLKQGISSTSKKASDKFSSLKQGVSSASKKAYETISIHKVETALYVGAIALAAGSAYSLYRINSRLSDLYELTGNKNYDEEVCSVDGAQAKLENFKDLTKTGLISAASKTKNSLVNFKDLTKTGLISAASKTKNSLVNFKDSTKDGLTSFKNKVSTISETMKSKRIYKANEKLCKRYGLGDECTNVNEGVCKANKLRNRIFKAKSGVVRNMKDCGKVISSVLSYISNAVRKNDHNKGDIVPYEVNTEIPEYKGDFEAFRTNECLCLCKR